MKKYRYIYGPVPSRRMGLSIGVSPIPKKCCNYSCVYCQLGRTDRLRNDIREFFPLKEILEEVKEYLSQDIKYDVITIVGEGEPTLYSKLGSLILNLKKLTAKPIAVITNGALLAEEKVREQLINADLVLPSLDAYDEETFKKINRPYGRISFKNVYEGLIKFSQEYKGSMWLEIMLVKGLNDDDVSLEKIKTLLENIKYNRLYINTVVRPPAEDWVEPVANERIEKAVDILKGTAINVLHSKGFFSEIEDDYEAVLSIIRRHPMNQYEINLFLSSRNSSSSDIEEVFAKLNKDRNIKVIDYKGYTTYRLAFNT